MRKLITLLLVFAASYSFSQKTVLINGYVIYGSQILPDISVQIVGKKTETKTNFKGKFKIQCEIGDTLVFEKKYSDNYKIEKYCVSDSNLIIVQLIPKIKLKSDGRPILYGSVYSLRTNHYAFLSTTILDENAINIGYSYYPEPFFPNKPFIPIQNTVSFGMNVSAFDKKYYFFPNIGIDLTGGYNLDRHGNVGFSFFVPNIKIGYWLTDFKTGANGLGYELGARLMNLRIKMFNISLIGSYDNYLMKSFMLSLRLSFINYTKVNPIPKFIQKQIIK